MASGAWFIGGVTLQIFRALVSTVMHVSSWRIAERSSIEVVELGKRAPCNAVKIDIHLHGGLNHASNLRVSLGPQPRHRLPLFFEVWLHV